MAERRLVRVSMTVDLLQELLTQGFRADLECEIGLPAGAVFIGSTTDAPSLDVNLFFEHESFQPVPMGEMVPLLMPRFRKYFAEPDEVPAVG